MNPLLIILLICIGVAIILVALHRISPTVYYAIVKYSKRLMKGVVFACVQFVMYVQGKPGRTKLSDKEKIDELTHTIEVLSHNIESLQTENKANIQEIKNINTQLNEKKELLAQSEKNLSELKTKHDQIQNEKERLRNSYDEVRGRLFTVSKAYVSDVFCNEFEQITACIDDAEDKLYGLLEKDSLKSDSLLHYLQVKRENDVTVFSGWYQTLKYASSLTGSGALDIESLSDNYKEQLLYLRCKAFERYYRPIISALLLCIEQYRITSTNWNRWNDFMAYLLNELTKLNFLIDYIPTGSKYDSSLYDNVLIVESNNKDAEVGVVERVITIGVNTREFEVPMQETEIEMNL